MKLLDLAIRSRWSTLLERSTNTNTSHPPITQDEFIEQNEDGLTVLHLACIQNQPVSIIRTLLYPTSFSVVEEDSEEGAVAKKKKVVAARCVDNGGMSPLHCVCSFNDDDDDDVEHYYGGGGWRGSNNQVEIVKELVNAYPDVLMMKDAWGWTPLHCLCSRVVAATATMEDGGGGDIVTEETARFGSYETNPSSFNNNDSNNNDEKEELSTVVKIANVLISAYPNVMQEQDFENRTPLDLLCEVGGCLDQLLRRRCSSSFLDEKEEGERQNIYSALSYQTSKGKLRDLWRIVELMVHYSSSPSYHPSNGTKFYDHHDDNKSFLLHKVASMHNTYPTLILHAMTLLYPQQASRKDSKGNLPLHLAIQCTQNEDPFGGGGGGGKKNGLFLLLNVSPPGALETCGIGNACYPFVLARVANRSSGGFDTDAEHGLELGSSSRLGLFFRILKSKPELMNG